MRVYELIVITKSNVSSPQRKKLHDMIKSWLKDTKIVKEDDLGQKVLRYPIKKEESGYFTVFSLETEQSLASDFDRRMQTNEDILRHLLIRRK